MGYRLKHVGCFFEKHVNIFCIYICHGNGIYYECFKIPLQSKRNVSLRKIMIDRLRVKRKYLL